MNSDVELNEFREAIGSYPNILKTFNDTVLSADECGFEGEDWDFFMSKNCRIWFFRRHLKVEREGSDVEIRDINKSPIVPFELSEIQLRVLDAFERRMNEGVKFRQRIMKCRRARVSTIYLAIGYHIVRFNENKKGLCFADRLETSRKLRRILDLFYQSDDLKDKPEIGKKTLAEGLYLHPPDIEKGVTERDSFILLGSAEQKNSGVGGSLDFFHWSEASLSQDAETHWTTISPSLQGALFDVAESTPSLTGQDAIIFPEFEAPSTNCDALFFSWMDVREYSIVNEGQERDFSPYVDHHLYGKEAEIMTEHKCSPCQMLWRRFKLDELRNANAFRQVFPISKEEAFYSSAGLFFHKSMIEMVKPKELKEVKNISFSDQGVDVSAMIDDTGSWRMYSRRSPDDNYLITADSAEGKTADKEGRDPDYSTAMVFKLRNPVEEVAFLRERIPPEIFAEQLAAAGKYYNNAIIIPERNGPGLATIVRLMQLYTNIYRQQKFQQGSFVMTQDYGFQTTSTSKVHALSCLLSRIRDSDKGLIIHSDIAYKEMSKFCQTGVRYGSLPGFHDDTITCMWLMAMCLFQTPSLIKQRQVLDGQVRSQRACIEKIIERDSWAMAQF